MNSLEQITFKVFYNHDTGIYLDKNASKVEAESKEIRKIVFEGKPNFKQLYDRLIWQEHLEREKLSIIENDGVPILPKYVRIKYIDEDGDRITIGCDEDLQNVIEEQVRRLLCDNNHMFFN